MGTYIRRTMPCPGDEGRTESGQQPGRRQIDETVNDRSRIRPDVRRSGDVNVRVQTKKT